MRMLKDVKYSHSDNGISFSCEKIEYVIFVEISKKEKTIRSKKK
jgi:hypothetical protein